MIMRKILSIFAAALVAVAVSADPVVLPATLDVTNVGFRSEGMPDFVLTEGDYAGTYFDMGAHDSANDTLLYAEWDVTIESIQYNLAVDVYNTNSWRVQLYVLNQAGDTVKSLRYKGSSGQCGHYPIGSIDMRDLEAGNYKVRAHAATAWSAMKLKDVIFEANYSGVSVALPGTLLPAYAELSANASLTDGAIAFKPSTAPNEYANWNVSFAEAGTYNVTIDITASNGHNYGVELIGEDEETSYGAVNEGGQKGDTGIKELGTITVPAAGNYIVHLTNAIQWSEAVLNSITIAAPAVELPYMAIIGDMNSWAGDELVPAEDQLTASITIHLDMNDNSGYGFKVLVGDKAYCIAPDDSGWYGFHRGWTSASNIDHEATSEEAFWLQIDKAGDYTFTWTIAEKKLDITFPDLVDITVYFVNTPNWTNVHAYAWSPEVAGWPGEQMTLTEQTIWGYQIYSYVVQDNRTSIIFNNGNGGDGNQTANLSLTDAKEGRPYFYKNQWFASLNDVVTAITNIEAATQIEKMIENGQLIIIRDGVKYNVLGTAL